MRLWRLVLSVYLPAFALLLAVAAVAARRNMPISFFLSDPVATARLPFYTGIVSNVGILLWAVAASTALFAGAVLHRQSSNDRVANFLLASGAFSALLMLDDMFLFHEIVAPSYIGIRQGLVLTTYAVLAVVGATTFIDVIWQTDYYLLITAALLLGISVVIDLSPQFLPEQLLWEDGAKLLGLVGWCLYVVRTTFHSVARRDRQISRKVEVD